MSVFSVVVAGAAVAVLGGAATVGAIVVVRTSGPIANQPTSAATAPSPVATHPSIEPSALNRIVTISGDPSRKGTFHDGMPRDAAYGSPSGVAATADGTIYVSDFANHIIIRIDSRGRASRFAGSGAEGVADGPPDQAQFVGPSGLALDPAGNLYVADGYGNRVRKVDPKGNVSTLAGGGAYGWGSGSFRDGLGDAARFDGVASVAIDGEGNILVADYANQRIRKISPSGAVSTLAGHGSIGRRDGAFASASFNFPSAIAIAPDGSIVIAEHGNNDIRRLDAQGLVATLTPSGPPVSAGGMFSYPSGIAVAYDGSIFLADTQSHRILRLTPNGAVIGTLGDAIAGFADGRATVARLNLPTGLTFLATGELLVTDKANAAIRKVTDR